MIGKEDEKNGSIDRLIKRVMPKRAVFPFEALALSPISAGHRASFGLSSHVSIARIKKKEKSYLRVASLSDPRTSAAASDGRHAGCCVPFRAVVCAPDLRKSQML